MMRGKPDENDDRLTVECDVVDCDASADHCPTPQQRMILRRSILRLARVCSPGNERNKLGHLLDCSRFLKTRTAKNRRE